MLFLKECYLIQFDCKHLEITMKKIFLGLFISAALISCDKSTIQQTSDSIKNTDSLFTKANDGLKTLDSIYKTINDSDSIAKTVIIPEIQKQ